MYYGHVTFKSEPNNSSNKNVHINSYNIQVVESFFKCALTPLVLNTLMQILRCHLPLLDLEPYQ